MMLAPRLTTPPVEGQPARRVQRGRVVPKHQLALPASRTLTSLREDTKAILACHPVRTTAACSYRCLALQAQDWRLEPPQLEERFFQRRASQNSPPS